MSSGESIKFEGKLRVHSPHHGTFAAATSTTSSSPLTPLCFLLHVAVCDCFCFLPFVPCFGHCRPISAISICCCCQCWSVRPPIGDSTHPSIWSILPASCLFGHEESLFGHEESHPTGTPVGQNCRFLSTNNFVVESDTPTTDVHLYSVPFLFLAYWRTCRIVQAS